MWNFSLLAATRSIETSMPFVLYRLMIYVAISLTYLFATLAGAGTLIAFSSFAANPTALANFGAVLGFLGIGYLMYKIRGAALFNVKAGTLALLAEQSRAATLPEGKAQIDFAQKAAAERFTPALFFQVSDALARALRSLPAPPCPMLDKIGNTALRNGIGWVERQLAGSCAPALMALHFTLEGNTPWQSAQTGLLIHSSHAASLLKFRGYALVFEIAGLGAAFALTLYPVNAAISLLPVDVGWWRYVFALTFAWSLKGAFFTPIATAAMAQLYLAQSSNLPDDADARAAALASQSPAAQYIRDMAST